MGALKLAATAAPVAHPNKSHPVDPPVDRVIKLAAAEAKPLSLQHGHHAGRLLQSHQRRTTRGHHRLNNEILTPSRRHQSLGLEQPNTNPSFRQNCANGSHRACHRPRFVSTHSHPKQHGGNATGNANHKGQPPETNMPKHPQRSQAKTHENTVQKLTQRGHMTAAFSFSCQSTSVP